ncbi:MAG: bifunctional 5,10-methylenetetrahydrofolate dehydrogenase/5,10-methenyltetrahydrofolate cyclohydrolase [Candidatus Dojkabacteria bacterium]
MIINGNKLAREKSEQIKDLIALISSNTGQKPSLKIIQVGEDPASTLYVFLKAKAARNIGIETERILFKSNTEKEVIKKAIENYAKDTDVDGIMIQSPIPKLDLDKSLELFNLIPQKKDVDGLSYANLGRLWQLKQLSDLSDINDLFISATPLAALDCLLIATGESVQEMDWLNYRRLASLDTFLRGKRALIINRSNIVGKPLAALLEMGNATVTLAHSKSTNLQDKNFLDKFDLILPATGVDGFYDLEMFSKDQVVIDIGINNNNPEAKVKGDVTFTRDSYDSKIHPLIAPVPGGVGPLTVTNLLNNTLISYARKHGVEFSNL